MSQSSRGKPELAMEKCGWDMGVGDCGCRDFWQTLREHSGTCDDHSKRINVRLERLFFLS